MFFGYLEKNTRYSYRVRVDSCDLLYSRRILSILDCNLIASVVMKVCEGVIFTCLLPVCVDSILFKVNSVYVL